MFCLFTQSSWIENKPSGNSKIETYFFFSHVDDFLSNMMTRELSMTSMIEDERHVLVVVSAYLKHESPIIASERTRYIASHIRHTFAASPETQQPDYLAHILAQQANLSLLFTRLLQVSNLEVSVVFMYDLVRKTLPPLASYPFTHVIISGGNYGHHNVNAREVLLQLPKNVPTLGICFGFQLLMRALFGATLRQATQPYDCVEDMRAYFTDCTTPILSRGPKSRLVFHHKHIVDLNYRPNGVYLCNTGEKLIAVEVANICGVQWHPEADDHEWEMVTAFLK